jgi:hypothetical protein
VFLKNNWTPAHGFVSKMLRLSEKFLPEDVFMRVLK